MQVYDLLETYLNFGMVIYFLYIPVFFAILAFLLLKTTSHSITKNYVSELGITTKKYQKVFKSSVLIYGILSLAIAVSSFRIFNTSIYTTYLMIFMLGISLGIILLSIFTMDKFLMAHIFSSGLFLSSLFAASIISIKLITNATNIIKEVLAINYAICFLIPIYIIIFLIDYFNAFQTELKLIIKYKGFIELSIIILSLIWNFIITGSLLNLIY